MMAAARTPVRKLVLKKHLSPMVVKELSTYPPGSFCKLLRANVIVLLLDMDTYDLLDMLADAQKLERKIDEAIAVLEVLHPRTCKYCDKIIEKYFQGLP